MTYVRDFVGDRVLALLADQVRGAPHGLRVGRGHSAPAGGANNTGIVEVAFDCRAAAHDRGEAARVLSPRRRA